MRVLLLQSPLGRPYRHVYPYGLCCLASALREKHEIKIVDPNVVPDPTNHIRNLLAEFQPHVIGVSLRNIDTVRNNVPWLFHLPFKSLLGELKRLSPETPLIVGGAGFSLFPGELMRMCPEIDFGVYLEGEECFPELLDNLSQPEQVKGLFYRKHSDILFSGKRTLPEIAKLPMVNRDFVDPAPYTTFPYDVGVETKRGCALDCAYCSYPRLNGRRLRLRAPDKVVDEIEELVNRYKLRSFSFIDSVFDVPREHCTAICEQILKRGVKIGWLAWFNGRDFDEALFSLALRAGCSFFAFSPDAYTPRTLKGLHKHLRHEDIARIYKIFKSHRGPVKVSFNFFANSPEIRLLDFLRTLVFCLKARVMLRHRLHRAGMDYIRILPNTALYRIALEKQTLAPDTDLLPDNAEHFQRLFYHEPNSSSVDFLMGVFRSLQGKGYAREQDQRGLPTG
jgi:anaerobic magnesium-protoporphyrin IX monomethyl ester cyclase